MPLDGVAFSRLDFYNGVAFSTELLRGRTFLDFWGETVLHIYLRLANVPECLYCR